MRKRVIVPEMMDAADLDPSEHLHALNGLARINRFTRVAEVMYQRLRRLSATSPRPLRVLDIATGSGDLPKHWIERAASEGFPLDVTAVDMSATAIAVANQQSTESGVHVDWLVANVLEDPLPDDFDVVTCSLFMHHLQDDDIVQLLRIMRDATEAGGEIRRILICDLARSRVNLSLVSVAAHLLSRSPIVHNDAKASVRAAMSRAEFAELAETALGSRPRVERVFPCRFFCEIRL